MKMTLKQLLQIRGSVERFLGAAGVPAKEAFRIRPWSKKVRSILRDYDETIERKVKEKGRQSERGNFEIPKEDSKALREFFEEIEELNEQEVELPDETIKMSDLEKVGGLVAEDFAALDFLIKE